MLPITHPGLDDTPGVPSLTEQKIRFK